VSGFGGQRENELEIGGSFDVVQDDIDAFGPGGEGLTKFGVCPEAIVRAP
jgi:hypothetical protein